MKKINEKEVTEEEFQELKRRYEQEGILLKEVAPNQYKTLLRG